MNQEMFNEEHVQLDEQNESVNRGTNLAFCRYCDQFMNNRIWHLYSFCIPNVTYEHLLKTPNVIWTPLNTECDIWTPFDKYRMWQVDWGCIPTETRIPYWIKLTPMEQYSNCMNVWTPIVWIPMDMYTDCMNVWTPMDQYTMLILLLNTYGHVYHIDVLNTFWQVYYVLLNTFWQVYHVDVVENLWSNV